jgi:hypothetical protein
MANTFEIIGSVIVGSGGSSTIEFTSIPATYTDICLVVSLRSTSGNVQGYCTAAFNGSTANFSIRGLGGTGSGSGGSWTTPSNFVGEVIGDGATASTFSNLAMYIPNYAGANNKSFSVDAVAENNATFAQVNFTAGLWSQTAAITSIALSPDTGTFKQYSTAYLYGIKNS